MARRDYKEDPQRDPRTNWKTLAIQQIQAYRNTVNTDGMILGRAGRIRADKLLHELQTDQSMSFYEFAQRWSNLEGEKLSAMLLPVIMYRLNSVTDPTYSVNYISAFKSYIQDIHGPRCLLAPQVCGVFYNLVGARNIRGPNAIPAPVELFRMIKEPMYDQRVKGRDGEEDPLVGFSMHETARSGTYDSRKSFFNEYLKPFIDRHLPYSGGERRPLEKEEMKAKVDVFIQSYKRFTNQTRLCCQFKKTGLERADSLQAAVARDYKDHESDTAQKFAARVAHKVNQLPESTLKAELMPVVQVLTGVTNEAIQSFAYEGTWDQKRDIMIGRKIQDSGILHEGPEVKHSYPSTFFTLGND